MSVPSNLKYTKEHEWVAGLEDGLIVSVGITNYASNQLGDVVYVQLPEVGATVENGDPIGEIESTKSVSDIFAPVTGEVVEVNEEVVDDPSLVNSDPYGEGWLVKIKVTSKSGSDDFLSDQQYSEYIKNSSEA
ncbi:MAG: glycine cleavage system protein GcvH [Nostoc sp. DedQUE11]|nr:glycine cleavage system protein GcvH [Nostoc sp. SerVER01]MDZ8025536.1 glycine cleavage system protein GcvH [Nostoc sp. DedQUE11]MDZ8073864.1 glycine cleavage system protein GcvH [Nostoc sp. DedQUE01]